MGEGKGGGGARVSDFFTKNTNLKQEGHDGPGSLT